MATPRSPVSSHAAAAAAKPLWSRDGISESDIREHLDAVLQSKAFLSSRGCSGFLRYVVDRTMAQDEAKLKEGAIAQAVFGRTSVVEGIEDSVVRVCAREVRKRERGLVFAAWATASTPP